MPGMPRPFAVAASNLGQIGTVITTFRSQEPSENLLPESVVLLKRFQYQYALRSFLLGNDRGGLWHASVGMES